ncbi:MAG: hypothetical protein CFE41_16020 [Burkholderiales bacterium PBB2]|nr:MAG: hypothetical protein CFE41_16020 [Burkholderiales bacterium PBB2]
MADIGKRLIQLRARRVGDDRPQRTALSAAQTLDVMAKSLYQSDEKWERNRQARPYTAYALGAMQEVGETYTRVSVEEAERVGKQLVPRLARRGIPAEYRLQGSVPLNVHIRRVSDVDLLLLDTSHRTYDRQGVMAASGAYLYQPARSSVSVLGSLRAGVVSSLREAFPAATVDSSGAKAVTVSGGSLQRVVDVVSSHWHDTIQYQSSRMERDRGVTILDSKKVTTIDNLPFLHIHRVGERCDGIFGGLRKSIRLCKQVKADMEMEGKTVSFPSFDIAATMYHADMGQLRMGLVYELAILAETQRFLDYLHHNKDYARTLVTPDGLRRIFDDPKKLDGLTQLSVEMDDLLKQVAREHGYGVSTYLSTEDLRTKLKLTNVEA